MSGGGREEGEAPGSTVGVLVPAAGAGRRMGGRRKQYLELGGVPVLQRALQPFLEHPAVVRVVVALPEEDVASPPAWLDHPRVRVIAGGSTRTDSVRRALAALSEDVDVVLVHDGVRPLVSRSVVDRCIAVAAAGTGAVAGIPAVDTMKEVAADGRVVGTPPRSSLWHAQTPQAFPRAMLEAAYRAARSEEGSGDTATDDAGLVERNGGAVRMVTGSTRNIKVTRPEDLAVAEACLSLDRPSEPVR